MARNVVARRTERAIGNISYEQPYIEYDKTKMKILNKKPKFQDIWERNMWYYLLIVLVPAILILIWVLLNKKEKEEPEKTIQKKASETLSPEPLSVQEITIDEKRPGKQETAKAEAAEPMAEKNGARSIKKEQAAPAEETTAKKPARTSKPRQKASTAAPVQKEQKPAAPKKPVEDDFSRLQGIGPKINQLFHNAGILTYQQLADADPVQLKNILVDASMFGADPRSWPEQAALASKEDWDSLEAFKQELKNKR